MNRVVFIFLSILLIVFPLTIENLENENVNYFELVKNITTELIHTVVKAQVKNPEEINLTNDQVALLKIKLDELEVTDLEFESNLIQNYESSIIQINKELNRNIAIYKYRELFECYSFLSKNNITGMVDTTESMFNFNKYETQVVRGQENNLKITYKSDLEIIEKAVI